MFPARRVDRAASILLALFAAGHGFLGTLATGSWMESATVWSFSGSVAAWMIAGVNWLRAGRPRDRALAAWALAGALGWAVLMVWLALAADMTRDVRIYLFIGVSLVLAGFSTRDLRRPSTGSGPTA